ncbi:hypothetical protein MMC07_008137 [Pseudocyphellaria aurata]|nr:hypothetical protein [Pseudocyphellaria aurata]
MAPSGVNPSSTSSSSSFPPQTQITQSPSQTQTNASSENAIADGVVTDSAGNPRAGTHLLSCTNCRKRKVKCNKTSPCAACERSSLPCVFPNRARLPRGRTGGSKTTNVELLRRLSKLEELLEIANQDGKDANTNPPRLPSRTTSADTVGRSGSSPAETLAAREISPTVSEDALNKYIGSTFWKSLTHEVAGLRETLVDVSDDEEASPSAFETDSSGSPITRSTRILGGDTKTRLLRSFHPSSTQILMLCTFFVDNFDPMFKVLHVPTLRRSVVDASSNLDEISGDRSLEALLFAMYCAAVTTITPEKCLQIFQEEKESLLARYRHGAEMAFANADLFTSADMVLLQALVIFLISVRCHDDSQFVWTLTAVAIRIGHSLGLHREGVESSFPPFMQEMRRRLWWQILVLDIHASEDRGSDPMILEATFNTKRPLNVNDEDLDPDSTYPVRPRIGFTQMSFCVINHEVWWLNQQCNILIPTFPGNDPRQLPSATFDEKVVVLDKFKRHLDEHFLVHLDLNNPLAWITSMVANLILKRMWLAAYQPLRHEQRATHYEGLTREQLLFRTVDVMESAHRLESEPMTAQYEWFLKSWVQWHALAVALAELCVQNQGPVVERAWTIIDTVWEPWAAHIADSRQGMLWRPIQKLSAKARRNRVGGSMMTPNPKTVGHHGHPMQLQSQPQQGRYDALQRPDLMTSPSQTYMTSIEPLQHLTLQNPTLQQQLRQPQRGMMPQVMPDRKMSVMSSPPLESGSGIGGSVGGSVGESMGTINWAEWDEFMQDFEMENRPSGDRDFVQQDAKTLGLWF